MRLVLHHLRKDLRAMWPLLALWVGVLSLQLFLPVHRLPDSMLQTERFRAILGLIQWVLAAVLPAMLILQDPVHGTVAFWFSRPISRLAMLSSKALGLALFFVVLPLAFQATGMLRAGLGGWALAAGLAEAAVYVSGITLAFAALASVGSSLARFVVVLTICFLGANIIGPALMAIVPPSLAGGGWTSLWKSQEVLRMALLLLLAAAMLVHQWFTRRSNRSLVMAGIAVLALSWIPSLRWDFLAPPARPLEENLELELEPGDDRCRQSGGDLRRLGLCGRFLFPSLATGLDLEIERVESRLTFPDGTSIEHLGWRPAGLIQRQLFGEDDPRATAGADLTSVRREAFQTLLEPPRDVYREYAHLPGTLELEIVLASYDVRELGRLPIEQGARFRAGATAAILERILISGGPPTTVDLDLQLHWIELLFAPWTWARPLDATLEHRTNPSFYLHTSGTTGAGSPLALPRPSLRSMHEQHTLRFSSRPARGQTRPALDAPSTAEEARAWLRDAEFVLRHRIRTGTLRAKLSVDDFRMADYAPRGAG